MWNRSITPVVFRIGLSCRTGYSHSVPGHFVLVRPVVQQSPLLGRPFYIYSLIKAVGVVVGFELLVMVVGEGTGRLAGLREGNTVALLGPLGNGFDIRRDAGKHLIVGGGIGVAPLVFLAEAMIAKGVAAHQCDVLIGGRSSTDLLGIEQFNNLRTPVHLVTEDGSAGEKGMVTSRLEQIIAIRRPEQVYACGPWAMLAVLAGIVETHRIPCQVSIETMMGCGMGACLSCVVHTRDPSTPYRHACKDGPVMDTRLIQF